MNAQVIVLNGGSSSGKSSIARSLQELLPDAWLSLSVVAEEREVDTTHAGPLDCARTIAAHLRSSLGDRPA